MLSKIPACRVLVLTTILVSIASLCPVGAQPQNPMGPGGPAGAPGQQGGNGPQDPEQRERMRQRFLQQQAQKTSSKKTSAYNYTTPQYNSSSTSSSSGEGATGVSMQKVETDMDKKFDNNSDGWLSPTEQEELENYKKYMESKTQSLYDGYTEDTGDERQ
ncbi:MAG: hypothetical protein PHH49_07465 [Candidatus Omnitrophica bacterium]|nr:hypothetical protein [Candidatus Omnitrophota bacterium]MDD5488773.1 hypothetical protein [Candidatus Omnitrophota bacterium]